MVRKEGGRGVGEFVMLVRMVGEVWRDWKEWDVYVGDGNGETFDDEELNNFYIETKSFI